MQQKPIRVLIVDDSPFTRKVFTEILNRHPSIEVVGIAHDGEDALEMVEKVKPDVLTLDLFMGGMDGLGFLREQMRRRPLPVVVCSSADKGGAEVVAAMEAGAVEFVQKSSPLADGEIYKTAEELAEKVIAAASVRLEKLDSGEALFHLELPGKRRSEGLFNVVVIGVSTGGPQALRSLLPSLPGNFPVPIAIVLHMPVGYTKPFAEKLNELSEIEVLEADENMEMKPGRAILARAGVHLSLRQMPGWPVFAHLDNMPKGYLHRPAVDVLFQSAAAIYGARTLGIVMTGMGDDGTKGAAWIKAEGGTIFAEAEESSIIYGMPRSVIEANLADRVVPLNQIAKTMLEVV